MVFVSFFVQGSVWVRVSYLISQSAAFSSESAIFRRKMGYGLCTRFVRVRYRLLGI